MPRGSNHGHGNQRGNAEQRRRRRVWLLVQFGDGDTAPCSLCGVELTLETITVDRHPIPGAAGGRYTRDNIRPACSPCNIMAGLELQRDLRVARLALR